ncbi:MAG: hypothetical protein Q4C61_07300 [Lachnospiraceae bacterium]|nr:hypothetical protein [Lachnospiraceae bacterium]
MINSIWAWTEAEIKTAAGMKNVMVHMRMKKYESFAEENAK